VSEADQGQDRKTVRLQGWITAICSAIAALFLLLDHVVGWRPALTVVGAWLQKNGLVIAFLAATLSSAFMVGRVFTGSLVPRRAVEQRELAIRREAFGQFEATLEESMTREKALQAAAENAMATAREATAQARRAAAISESFINAVRNKPVA
jgi:hypothetical protein